LPFTGGPGVTAFYFGALALVVVALVGALRRRRGEVVEIATEIRA
jgi:MYXO-CTERM domain-containing protein